MERISNDKSCRDKRLFTVTAVPESAAVLASVVVESFRKPALDKLAPRRGRDRDTHAMVDDDAAANMIKRKEKRCIDYKDLSKKPGQLEINLMLFPESMLCEYTGRRMNL